MSDFVFEVAARAVEPITFEITGEKHVYKFTPPKQALMVLPLLQADGVDDEQATIMFYQARFAWLKKGLSEKDAARLVARLEDLDDPFDSEHLGNLIEQLTEHISGRPTM